jgi:protein associated with RNAse G/E
MDHPPITVIKNDHTGQEVWRYEGRVLERTANRVMLEALFNRDEVDLDYAVFRRGDRFVEYFYSDRWYNVFAVHDATDDHLKGWYCNIARPAELGETVIRQDDLALDLFVYPDRRMIVLDRDEFEALDLNDPTRSAALKALAELQKMAQQGQPPFVLPN